MCIDLCPFASVIDDSRTSSDLKNAIATFLSRNSICNCIDGNS